MYETKDFSNLLGMSGFSDQLLQNHFKLYEGYVKNTNVVKEKIAGLEAGTPECNELTRRFGWEWNGMRLHELYFENMTSKDELLSDDSSLNKKMIDSFGSGQAFHDDFIKTASLRGIGWVVTYYDRVADMLFNVWIDEHGTNHLSGATPLLVMDMWEHAFMVDYGLDKKSYIDAFIKRINWSVVQKRFEE